MSTLLSDAARRPDLFLWNGPIPGPELASWLNDRCWTLPPDLVSFLSETGGGNVFESEWILGPYGDSSLGTDLESVNQFHWSRGLGDACLVFNTGGFFSVIDQPRGDYVVVSEKDYRTDSRYPTLEAWYLGTARKEFGRKYGL